MQTEHLSSKLAATLLIAQGTAKQIQLLVLDRFLISNHF